MSVTITVHDPLAAQLRSEAQQQQVSVDELVADLLVRVLKRDQDPNWYSTNLRRLTLIRKSAAVELTPQEVSQLQQLQSLADQRLEALDAERLVEVERIEREVMLALGES
jgi:hypothetical protein